MPLRKFLSSIKQRKVTGPAHIEQAPTYAPLNAARGQVRTARILPGNFDEPVSVDLIVVELSAIDCEALSYTWGDPTPLKQITLNGVRHNIALNLYDALPYLRCEIRYRDIWIDALCIDQTNTEERGQQVKLMGEIFSRCSVVAWLGSPRQLPNFGLAVAFFAASSTLARPTAPELLPNTRIAGHLFDMPSEDPHCDFDANPQLAQVWTQRHAAAVYELTSVSWWERVWTVQESVLCAKLLFKCGHNEITADQALEVGDNFQEHVRNHCCKISSSDAGHNDLSTLLDVGFIHLFQLREARIRPYDSYSRSDLLGVLSEFRHRVCSEPHDKIFGLLGLVRRYGVKDLVDLNTDYATDAVSLFTRVAHQITQNSVNLDSLSLCYPTVGQSTFEHLPRWVPNWTNNTEGDRETCRILEVRRRHLEMYSASRGSTLERVYCRIGRLERAHHHMDRLERAYYPIDRLKGAYHHDDRQWLWVQGRRIAVVGKLSASLPLHGESLQAWLDAWYSEIEQYFGDVTQRRDEYDAAVAEGAWTRILCTDVCLMQNGSTCRVTDVTTLKEAFRAWEQWRAEDLDSETNFWGYVFDAATAMRRLFVSDVSDEPLRLGLAPEGARPGDEIFLLRGGKLPYVVRPRETESGVDKCYDFIGDAFVLGVMDGEAWDESDLQDMLLF